MNDPATTSPVADTQSQPAPAMPFPSERPRLRLLIPSIVLCLFWIMTEASFQFEMGMFYRFVTRTALLLALLIYFLAWGFSRRHFTLAQRWFVFAMVLTGIVLAGKFGHPSAGVFAAALIGIPAVLTLSIVWLWISRNRGSRSELAGLAIVTCAVFGTISLLRWNGLDGRQRSELSWRWTPSAEERFLQTANTSTPAPIEKQRPPLTEADDDWVSFRGGRHESRVTGVELCDWSTTPPSEAWRRRVGPGWSSLIAIGDLLFTQEQRGEKEAVVCYDAGSGDEVWVHAPQAQNERFDEKLSGAGPRATPTFHDNRIYAYGAKGSLECLDAVTGESIWSHALFNEYNVIVPQWGSSSSPTIVDDLVVVFVGGKNENSLLAFDRKQGELRWRQSGGPISYSTPQVMTIAGVRQIVMHDNEALRGLNIDDGKLLWKHPSPHTVSFEPMIQPHQIADERLIVNWDSGLICLQFRREGDDWKMEELWQSLKMKPSFNDFVIHDDHLYGLDDGILCCIDIAQGKRKWKRGRYGYGQMLILPELGEMIVITERGEVVRVALDPRAHRELGSFKAIEGKTWNHPLLAHGRLIVRNGEEMACFNLANNDGKARK